MANRPAPTLIFVSHKAACPTFQGKEEERRREVNRTA